MTKSNSSFENVAVTIVTTGLVGCLFVFFFPIMILLMIVSAIIDGYVLHQYWAWFVVAGFGVEQISLFTCIGVISLYTFIRSTKSYSKSDDNSVYGAMLYTLSTTFIRPVLFYGIGYLWYWYGQNILTNFGFSS